MNKCVKCGKQDVAYKSTKLCGACQREYNEWLGPRMMSAYRLKGTFISDEESSREPWPKPMYEVIDREMETEIQKELEKDEELEYGKAIPK